MWIGFSKRIYVPRKERPFIDFAWSATKLFVRWFLIVLFTWWTLQAIFT